MTNAPEPLRTIAKNRKAWHDYTIEDELECGIVLTGTEVKSLRAGKCSIAEAHVRVRNGEMFLIGAHIQEYTQGNVHNHEPVHDRKLLCHKREIERWYKRVREQGITIVPLELYFKGSRVKVLLGLARGKKMHDKRAAERKREDHRDMDRAQSRRR